MNECTTWNVSLLGRDVVCCQGLLEEGMSTISFGLGVLVGAGAMGATVVLVFILDVFKGWD